VDFEKVTLLHNLHMKSPPNPLDSPWVRGGLGSERNAAVAIIVFVEREERELRELLLSAGVGRP
jgi:hypothetical protein